MNIRWCTHQADGFGDAVTFCTTTAAVEPAVETTAPGAGAGILLLEVAATVRPAAAWPPAHRRAHHEARPSGDPRASRELVTLER
jgi:hypothetical protein